MVELLLDLIDFVLLGGQETIRDFIAFPKNNSGRDTMIDAPSRLNEEQKNELGLIVKQ